MKKKILLLMMLPLLIFLVSCASTSVTSEANLKIGALLPLTGYISSKGITAQAAAQLAEDDINAYFATNGSSYRVSITIYDTESSPTRALTVLENSVSAEINVVTGPMASLSVDYVKTYAASNEVLIISPSSTDYGLAIDSDNVFRLVPDDRAQAAAVANTLYDDGIRCLAVLYKDITWAEDLLNLTKTQFQSLGGAVTAEVYYGAKNVSVFGSTLSALNSSIEAITAYVTSEIAVLLISYDEGVEILSQASTYETLANVRWVGSDGLTSNADLLTNSTAAAFAVTTGFTSPIFHEYETTTGNAIKSEIQASLGYVPDVYALLTYDALWLAALTLADSSDTSLANLKTSLASVATDYEGASGTIEFNSAGDRAQTSYDFWEITESGGSYAWSKHSEYSGD